MKPWPKHPVIYEINTWVWLEGLSEEFKSPVTLAKVPRDKWDGIADLKVDAVWFMGVWERSPTGIDIANKNEGLLADFRRALPDYRTEDNVGLLIVCDNTWLTSTSEDPLAWLLPGESSPIGGSDLSSISSPTMWPLTTPGYPRTLSISSREMTKTCAGTPPHLLQPGEGFLPVAGTPTSLHGRTYSS